MDFLFCPNCNKKTGHKRALGMGTLIGGALTFGVSLATIPFYPKRCIVCGRKTTEEDHTETASPAELTSKLESPVVLCQMCGEPNATYDTNCIFCSAPILENE